jgi:hypothetical protein
MRMNPYGAAPMENPNNIRQAMNRNDPRQRGLLGAAWNLGYVSRFAYGGAAAITLGDTVGAFGVLHTPEPWPQPWYDDHGGLFPVFHVVRGLAGLSGARLRQVDSSSSLIASLAAEGPDGLELWVANLTADPQRIDLPAEAHSRAVLDQENFVAAARDPDLLDGLRPVASPLVLDGFAVARVRLR